MTTATIPQALSAGTLIDDDVVNLSGETLGDVKEIMIDLDTGHVAYVVLSCGGFLGIGEKLFAVPWNALQVNMDNHTLIFDVDKDRLKQAPGFNPDDWPNMADRTWGQSIHDYYGTRPYWQ